jgi:alpha-L-fucosidase
LPDARVRRPALCGALLFLLVVPPALPAEAPVRGPDRDVVRQWQNRKFGMFIHWGLYSIPGGVWQGRNITNGYSEQIQSHAPIPREEYETLAAQFNPVEWDPEKVVALAKRAGMKFIVITSKHHDGFNMFGTRLTRYNVVDATPYRRDVVKELAEACRKAGIKFGVYYSTIDWHYPDATTWTDDNNNEIPPKHADFNVGQLRELLTSYGPLTEIWFDMGKPTPEQSQRFTDTVHSLQPACMVSGRVFNHKGDFTVMGDNRIPSVIIDEPWQTPASIYHETWGYRSWQPRVDLPGKIQEHIVKLVEVVSRGGNYLLNVGPRGDGSIVEFEADVITGVGDWLNVNSEAIYGSTPQPFRQLDYGYATVKPGRLYLLVRNWPVDGVLRLPGLKTPIRRAYLLGDKAKTALKTGADFVEVHGGPAPAPVSVVVAEYDGRLRVVPPTVKPAADGTITLTASQANVFYNYNGRGYYERPTIYKQQWDVTAPAGTYKVQVFPKGDLPMVLNIGSKTVPITTESVELAAADYWTLAITPPHPFVKGTQTGGGVDRVVLTPVR